VNHNLVPLSYQLKGGDQIEILTSNSQHPQKEWLKLVTTAKARNCLNQYFKREERKYMKHGERLVADAISMDKDLAANPEKSLARLLDYYGSESLSELYTAIGQGSIRLTNIHDIVFPKRGLLSYIPFIGKKDTPANERNGENQEIVKPKKGSHAIVLTDENLGKDYLLSNCCHPIPGDEVLGFLDEKGQMHIHKVDCPEANLLKTSYGKRLYSATWNTHRVQSFVETIELKGIDKFGVFIQVLQTITTEFHINMRAIHMSSDDGIFQGTMEIYVYDKSELEDLLKAIRKIDDIKEVKRVNID
jgi:GTP pyrophosphokinase